MGAKAWSSEDKKALIDGCFILTMERGLKVPYERGVLVNLALEVMSKWPDDSRRFISTVVQVRWVEEAILELRTKPVTVSLPSTPTSSSPTVSVMIPKTELVEKLHSNESVWDMIKREVRKTPIIETLVESIAEQIVDDIQAKVTAKLLGRGIAVGDEKPTEVAAVKETPTVQTPAVKAATPAKKENKKTVKLQSLKQLGELASVIKNAERSEKHDLKTIVVCGLYAEQAAILKREFMGKAIVHVPFVEHFAEHDVARNADVVFLITAKINHSNEEYMRSFVPRERFRYVSGNGLSAVKRDLYRYLDEVQKTA